MAFKKALFFIKVLVTVFVILQDVSITSANVDCGGKSFYCVNSTNFKICVDFGNGISSTIDDFVVTCPEGTECNNNNNFECEISKPTTQSANLLLSEAVTNDERNLRSDEPSQMPMDNISPTTFADTSVTEIISPAKKINESIVEVVKSDFKTKRVLPNIQITNNEDQKKSGTSESVLISEYIDKHLEDLPVKTTISNLKKNNTLIHYNKNVTENRVKTKVDLNNPKVQISGSNDTSYLLVLGSENTIISDEFRPESLHEEINGNRTIALELLRQNNSEVIIKNSTSNNSLAAKLPIQNYEVNTQSMNHAGADAKLAQKNEELKQNVTSSEMKETNIIIQKDPKQISVNDTMIGEKSEISASNTNGLVNIEPFNVNSNVSYTFVGSTESLNGTLFVHNSTFAPVLLPSDKNNDQNTFPVNLNSVTGNTSTSSQRLLERGVFHPVNMPDAKNSKISNIGNAKLDENTQMTDDLVGVKQAEETLEKQPKEVTTDATLEETTVSVSRLSNSVGKAESKPASTDTFLTDKNINKHAFLKNLYESNNITVEQFLLDNNGTNDKEQYTGLKLPETSTQSNITLLLKSDEIPTTTQKTITSMKEENNINTTVERIIVPITENSKNYKSVAATEMNETSSVTALDKEDIDISASTSVNVDVVPHDIIGSVHNNIEIPNTNSTIESQNVVIDRSDKGLNSDATAYVTESLPEPGKILNNIPKFNLQKKTNDVIQNVTTYINKGIIESNQKATNHGNIAIDVSEVSIIDFDITKTTTTLESVTPASLEDISLNTRNETNFQIATQNKPYKIEHIESRNASTGANIKNSQDSAFRDNSSLSNIKLPQNDTLLSPIQTMNTQFKQYSELFSTTEATNKQNKTHAPEKINNSKENVTINNNNNTSQESAQRKPKHFSKIEALIIQPTLEKINTETNQRASVLVEDLASKNQDVLSTTASTNSQYLAPTLEKTNKVNEHHINNSNNKLQDSALRKDFVLFTTQASKIQNFTLIEVPINNVPVDSTTQSIALKKDQFSSIIEPTTKTYYSESTEGNIKHVNGHVKTVSIDSLTNNNYSSHSPLKNDGGLSTNTMQAIITQNSATTPEEVSMKKGHDTTVTVNSINYDTLQDSTSKNIEVLSENKAVTTQNTELAPEKTETEKELARIVLVNTKLKDSALKNKDVLSTTTNQVTFTQHSATTTEKISKRKDHNTTGTIDNINNDTLQDSTTRNIEVLSANHVLNTQNHVLAPGKADLEKEQATFVLVNSSKPINTPEQNNNTGDTTITAVDTTTVVSVGSSLQNFDFNNDKVLLITDTKFVQNFLLEKNNTASGHGNIVSSDANKNIPDLAIKNDHDVLSAIKTLNTQYLAPTSKANVERDQATSISVDSILQVSTLKKKEVISNTQATVIQYSASTPEINDTANEHANAVSIESVNRNIYTSVDRTTQAPIIQTLTTTPGNINNKGHTTIIPVDTTTFIQDSPTSKYSTKINRLNEHASTISVDSVNKYNTLQYTAVKNDEALSVTEAQNSQNSARSILEDSDLNNGKVLVTLQLQVKNVQNSLPEKINTTSKNSIMVSLDSNKNINAISGLANEEDEVLSATKTLNSQILEKPNVEGDQAMIISADSVLQTSDLQKEDEVLSATKTLDTQTLEKPNVQGDQAMIISADSVLQTSDLQKEDEVLSATKTLDTQTLEKPNVGGDQAMIISTDSVLKTSDLQKEDEVLSVTKTLDTKYLAPTLEKPNVERDQTMIISADSVLQTSDLQKDGGMSTTEATVKQYSAPALENNKTGNGYIQYTAVKHDEALSVTEAQNNQNATRSILQDSDLNNGKVLVTLQVKNVQNSLPEKINTTNKNSIMVSLDTSSNKNINALSGLVNKEDEVLSATKTLNSQILEKPNVEGDQAMIISADSVLQTSDLQKEDEVLSATKTLDTQTLEKPNVQGDQAMIISADSVLQTSDLQKEDEVLSATKTLDTQTLEKPNVGGDQAMIISTDSVLKTSDLQKEDEVLSVTKTLDTKYLAPTLEKPNVERDQTMIISADSVLQTSDLQKDGGMSTTEATVKQYSAPALENNKTGTGYAKGVSVDSINSNIYTRIIGTTEAPIIHNSTISPAQINNKERTTIMPEDPPLKKDEVLSMSETHETHYLAKIDTVNEYGSTISVESVNKNNQSSQDTVVKHSEVLFMTQAQNTYNSAHKTLQSSNTNNEKVLPTTPANLVQKSLPDTQYLAPTLEKAKEERHETAKTTAVDSIIQSLDLKEDDVLSTTQPTVTQYPESASENNNTANGHAQTLPIDSVNSHIYTLVDSKLKATVPINGDILSTTEALSINNSVPTSTVTIEGILPSSKNNEALLTTESIIIIQYATPTPEKNMSINERAMTVSMDSVNNNIYTLKTNEVLSAKTPGKTNSENVQAMTETKEPNINATVQNNTKVAKPQENLNIIKVNSNNGNDDSQIQKPTIHSKPQTTNNYAKITTIEEKSEKQTESKTNYKANNNTLNKILYSNDVKNISGKSQDNMNNTVTRVIGETKQKSTSEPQKSTQHTSTIQINYHAPSKNSELTRENNKTSLVYGNQLRNQSIESLLNTIKKLISDQEPTKSKNQANVFEYLMRHIKNDGTFVKHNYTRLDNIKHSTLKQPSLPQINKQKEVNYTLTNTMKSYQLSRVEHAFNAEKGSISIDNVIKGVRGTNELTKINIDNHTAAVKQIKSNITTINVPSEQNSTIPEKDKKLTQRPNIENNKHESNSKIEHTEPEKHKQKSENNSTTICKGHRRGRYSDMDDCRKFYVCVGSHKYITGYCPNNTVFSELRKQCTKNLSHCVRGGEFHCVFPGRYIDYEHGNIYYICANNSLGEFVRFKLQCQGDYYLDRNTVKCTREPSKYSTTLETYPEPDGKSSSYTDIESPESEECTKEGKFPEPGDCRRYYECHKTKKSKFRKRSKKCDKDEMFHKGKKKCVDAESYECESEGKG